MENQFEIQKKRNILSHQLHENKGFRGGDPSGKKFWRRGTRCLNRSFLGSAFNQSNFGIGFEEFPTKANW